MNQTLGILNVAIGKRYISYWAGLAASLDFHCQQIGEVRLHVFTNLPGEIDSISSELTHVKVKTYPAPAVGWPEATLLRYEFFLTAEAHFEEDVLAYLDADMEVTGDFTPELIGNIFEKGIVLVDHPGYFRPQGFSERCFLYIRHPKLIIHDLRSILFEGNLGQWEKRVESRAYVPRRLRKSYVCGGVWFGKKDDLLALIRELAGNTRADLGNGIVARWHDESHLNAAHAFHEYSTLPPSYCFSEGAPNLKGLTPLIKAIDKRIA